jgi:hypothetical protein
MKKALLVSTAIVGGPLLLATPAMAGGVEFSIGGNMDIQAGFMDADVDLPDRGYDIVTDTEIHFNFKGEADNGLRYGAQVQLEADQGGTNNADEVWTWLEGNWGRVQLGDQDGAEDTMVYDAGLTQSGVGGAMQHRFPISRTPAMPPRSLTSRRGSRAFRSAPASRRRPIAPARTSPTTPRPATPRSRTTSPSASTTRRLSTTLALAFPWAAASATR